MYKILCIIHLAKDTIPFVKMIGCHPVNFNYFIMVSDSRVLPVCMLQLPIFFSAMHFYLSKIVIIYFVSINFVVYTLLVYTLLVIDCHYSLAYPHCTTEIF